MDFIERTKKSICESLIIDSINDNFVMYEGRNVLGKIELSDHFI